MDEDVRVPERVTRVHSREGRESMEAIIVGVLWAAAGAAAYAVIWNRWHGGQ